MHFAESNDRLFVRFLDSCGGWRGGGVMHDSNTESAVKTIAEEQFVSNIIILWKSATIHGLYRQLGLPTALYLSRKWLSGQW